MLIEATIKILAAKYLFFSYVYHKRQHTSHLSHQIINYQIFNSVFSVNYVKKNVKLNKFIFILMKKNGPRHFVVRLNKEIFNPRKKRKLKNSAVLKKKFYSNDICVYAAHVKLMCLTTYQTNNDG